MESQQERMLELRQMALRLRSAELRMQLAVDTEALRTPLALVDQGRQAVLWLRARPTVAVAGAAGMAALLTGFKPGRLLRWARRGLWAWRWISKLSGLAKPM